MCVKNTAWNISCVITCIIAALFYLCCLKEETITSTHVAASKTGNLLSRLSCFRLICFLTANTMFCFQNKFTLLCFSIFNFFLDCVIHKQSFGGKIIGFQSLKWPHNGYTVWGSKGKRSNSTPFCFGCPDTFVTGVYADKNCSTFLFSLFIYFFIYQCYYFLSFLCYTSTSKGTIMEIRSA